MRLLRKLTNWWRGRRIEPGTRDHAMAEEARREGIDESDWAQVEPPPD